MALRLKGEALIALGRDEEAADSLKESIAREAGDLADYAYLSVALENLGERELALSILYDGIKTLPSDVPTMGPASARFSPNEEELPGAKRSSY